MNYLENRVREFAYQIWESEGRPHGQDARHWEMAQKLAESEVRLKGAVVSDHEQSVTPKKSVKTKKTAQPDTESTHAATNAGVPPVVSDSFDAAPATKSKTKAASGKAKKADAESKPKKAASEKTERTKKTKLVKDVVETELPPQ